MILVHDSPGEQRATRVLDGVLREFLSYRPGAPDGLGDVLVGRVLTRVPAMAGAFLALPEGEGFLPDSDGGGALSDGAIVAVRVVRSAQGGKGPRLSTRGCPGGVGGPLRLLQRGPSALEELVAAYPADEVVRGCFDDALEAEIEALGDEVAALPNGMRAVISALPALTAIDLNGAGATGGARGGKAQAQFAANRDCLPALVRQIVLRNLSGAILVDPAGVPTRKRSALGPFLAAALAEDRAGARLAGFSHLGFAEILRPRRRPPLHELLETPLGAGLAALRRAEAEEAARPGRRLRLRAAPSVLAALREEADALAALNRRLTYPVLLSENPPAGCRWAVEDGDD